MDRTVAHAAQAAQVGVSRRGVFTLSLDFELIWGTLDRYGPRAFAAACDQERRHVVGRLLELFTAYGVSATWCIVGHLFLDRCDAHGGRKHPDIVPPVGRADWFAADPSTDEATDPIFYGRSLVAAIAGCRPRQEIGCHSFSHVIFDDPGTTVETAASELRRCVELAAELGITMRSFVYPRNRVGHLDLLPRFGFTCYRGPEAMPGRGRVGRGTGRVWHVLRVLARTTPDVVAPVETLPGLWNVPASMVYLPTHGLRRLIPVSFRAARAIKGLRRAAAAGRVFHLWLHPTSLAEQTEAMFGGLEAVLAEARTLRDRGDLEILPMAEVAVRAAGETIARPVGIAAGAVKEDT